jgi:hypothetical protein
MEAIFHARARSTKMATVEKLPVLNPDHFEVRIVSPHLGTPAAAAEELLAFEPLQVCEAVLVTILRNPPLDVRQPLNQRIVTSTS